MIEYCKHICICCTFLCNIIKPACDLYHYARVSRIGTGINVNTSLYSYVLRKYRILYTVAMQPQHNYAYGHFLHTERIS